ncbi:MAG TPA: hypothetical protein VFL85_02440, partial [Candidatus Saccharimonadales bacterium]|nr:hypothetical protein [Candidatus Saccharimonadales bacterium]
MPTQTLPNPVKFAHALRPVVLGLFVVSVLLSSLLLSFSRPATATAAANPTLNFQARLETSSGAIAPDGTYNVEFKLYNSTTSTGSAQGSCSGDATCLWTETRTAANQVTVTNGYLTVNLGSVTPFPANLNWDQDLYLTMNIGGTTATPSWDGEMSPRLKLTAVPYAMQAKSANQLQSQQGSSTASLQFGNLTTSGNQIFQLQDQGAAGTYSLLTQTMANGSYIQNQTAVQQTGGFNLIAGSDTPVAALQGFAGSTSPVLKLRAGATATSSDLIQGFDPNNNKVFSVYNNGDLYLNSTISTFNKSSGDTNNLYVRSGNADAGASGSLYLDVGTATTTTGAINIGTVNASAVNIGRSGVTTNVMNSLNVTSTDGTSVIIQGTNAN